MPAAAIAVRGPTILESLWWPNHNIGKLGPRSSPQAWAADLHRHKVTKVGDSMEFLVEDVLDRFQLTVFQNHQHRTAPITVRQHDGCMYINNEGYIGSSVDDLVGYAIHEGELEPWLFPMVHECRTTLCRRKLSLHMTARDGKPEFDGQRELEPLP